MNDPVTPWDVATNAIAESTPKLVWGTIIQQACEQYVATKVADISAGIIKERELCKQDVCLYCGGRALGYKRIPDGPNEADNWTHQYTGTMRTEDRVLCIASAIFAHENFERWQQANSK